MKTLLSICLCCACLFTFANTKKTKKQNPIRIDSIFVQKSSKQLSVYAEGKFIKKYNISIGENAIGAKMQKGDNHTPEGIYYITDKNANSHYYKNLGISYPNDNDRKSCAKRNVATGGDIKIHGYADANGNTKNRNTVYTYTWGCIAVTNADMDELFESVIVGAVINIVP